MFRILIILTIGIVFSSRGYTQDTIAVSTEWNLIGATSTMPLSQLRSEPPGIVISSYFGYTPSGYIATDTLRKGKGYWVRVSQDGFLLFPSFQNNAVRFVTPDTIEVNQDWNLIGAISTKALTGLRSEPPGIIISKYFGYTSIGYALEDTLQKGRGYWVKASQAGILIPTLASLPPDKPLYYYPENGAEDVEPAPIIRWTCLDPENDPLTYDVYLDSINPPTIRVASNWRGNYHLSSVLKNSKTYFWKIVATDYFGNSTSSDVWSFTTRAAAISPCGGITSVRYANKTYHTVEIGNQCWFKENLNVGTMVDSLRNQTNNDTIEKYCYRNLTSNCNTYGGLYQWHEAMQYSTTGDSQGICPQGWHVPTYDNILGLWDGAGYNGNGYKAIGQGAGGGAGTNTSGFSALLAGLRSHYQKFQALGTTFYLWTSYVQGQSGGYFYLEYGNSSVHLASYSVDGGFSVRCLKN